MNLRSPLSRISGGIRRLKGGGRALETAQDRRDDATDRAALDKALDDQAAGRLETISHADLKARLGLD